MARNTYRRRPGGKREELTSLERSLPWHVRFWNRFALLRGIRRLKKWGLYSLAAAAVLWGLFWAAGKIMNSAYNLDLRSIEYSSNGIIGREAALAILDLKESVNLATLDTTELERRAIAHPAVASARVQKELPSTLRIEVEARVPVVQIEYEDSLASVDAGANLCFMDPQGVVFPYDASLHADYRHIPVWYVTPADIAPLRPGAQVARKICGPVVELLRLINRYAVSEIPPVCSLERPKDWQIVVHLENGTEAMMAVYNLPEQVERLHMALRHARSVNKHIRRANVIPRVNPVVEYGEAPPAPDNPDDAPVAREVEE